MRVIIIDDHALFRDGLKGLLELRSIDVAGVAADGKEGIELAKKIVADGEGATKFIEITVQSAKNENQAKKAAFAIANSNLVKTAAFGCNPNWGRVAAAVGSLGLKIDEKHLKIKFSSFDKKNIRICVDLSLGSAKATVYTSDLSQGYVYINAKYN